MEGHTLPHKQYTIVEPRTWGERWLGPAGTTYQLDNKWQLGPLTVSFKELTVKLMTRVKTAKQTKLPPASEEAWEKRDLCVDWSLTWKLRSQFSSPRDIVPLLQLQHRNLTCAKQMGGDSTICRARGCHHEESQGHLLECVHIQRDFWTPITRILIELKLLEDDRLLDNSNWCRDSQRRQLYIACQWEGKPVSRETFDMIAWAWRALYAATTKSRLEDLPLDLTQAVWVTVRYALTRVKAHGFKWNRWFRRQCLWQEARMKYMPEKHSKYALIEFDECANYAINKDLKLLYKSTQEKATRARVAAGGRQRENG